MASGSEAHRGTAIGAEILSRVALQSHQLESVLAPEKPIAEIIELLSESVGPPTPRLNLEPELSEAITERLSKTVHRRVA